MCYNTARKPKQNCLLMYGGTCSFLVNALVWRNTDSTVTDFILVIGEYIVTANVKNSQKNAVKAF